ncbi:efflux transporter, outer membrane factor (OMF) lipoprotein, NodT family [Nitrosomonas sp. PY1]|uniref:efflux transporter outer membrane subunit n=1 Tax=Nitrosomonas sp. PY1 TaxID=1803906 RepID=UPI001FC7DF48|nr:efflux transporter outer membrane subunit [Nitrosomonas sp. PY1]GKS68910.1 efflux transporter, outer membrane factor (OMF) lipoprotein, NodT family [Nitrosomonas sp. PY1]
MQSLFLNLWYFGIKLSGYLLAVAILAACGTFPAVNLSPSYQPTQFVVPDSWQGQSPFIKANPSDGELRPDWWKLYDDPVLDGLIEQAMIANPDLHAAAERFIQARNIMMKARSQYIPKVGIGFGASNNRQSDHSLFRGLGEHDQDVRVNTGGIASWEPDFWSELRNAARIGIYRAQERAADYGNARLSLQAEVASYYFILRGLDAQIAIYTQSIDLYNYSLNIVEEQFSGAIASALDVARAQSLLYSTESKIAIIRSERQMMEQAIAVLLNLAPANFKLEPVDNFHQINLYIPQTFPSTLLERRPDIAAMERRMAQANSAIGIARAAFFPNVAFRLGGGLEDSGLNLLSLANSFWAYGSTVSLPIFQGGYRRAQLQQSWSAYRETEDLYRATVLNAFREVEGNLIQTHWLTIAADRQDASVGANQKTQDLTMELYVGGLATSLELIYAQLNTLIARVESVQIKINLLKASVALIRSLGGGWNYKDLPKDDQIQPFQVFQYWNLEKPMPVGGIDVNIDKPAVNDLTKPFTNH